MSDIFKHQKLWKLEYLRLNQMLSECEINKAKARVNYVVEPNHQHSDCIKIAFQWLDAQIKTQNPKKTGDYGLKGTIEEWAGRYISSSDIIVAAFMHPQIEGTFPHFNISKRYTFPSFERLEGIGEAYKHRSSYRFYLYHYKYVEKNGIRLLASKIMENEWQPK